MMRMRAECTVIFNMSVVALPRGNLNHAIALHMYDMENVGLSHFSSEGLQSIGEIRCLVINHLFHIVWHQ